MAVANGEAGGFARISPRAIAARVTAWRRDGSDRAVAQRNAGSAFLIRSASAGIIYLTQVLLARWMGRFEFGVYVYVWAWVGFLGMWAAGGIAPAAQRFIPEYRARGDEAGLRGFLLGSRWVSFAYGTVAGLLLAVTVMLLTHRIAPYYWLPLMIGAAVIPIFPVSSVQDTIARCFNWIELGLIPNYVIHPMIICTAVAAVHFSGVGVTALHGLVAAALGMWTMTLIQTALLRRRLKRAVAPGERRYELRYWMVTALPIAFVDGFFLLLTYVDTLILQIFVGPADIAVYYASTKTLAILNFIYFAVSAASAHRFAQYYVNGEHDKLASFLQDTVRWTFWPSLALGLVMLALGRPILSLFGPGFAEGYPLLFVLAIGLMARASVGPAERLLSMQDQQIASAMIYAGAFATNLVLCLLLIPHFGLMGAAASTASAVVTESVLLFVVSKRKLGLHIFVFGR
ncbi:MAG TPA: lipopolysaccharide biosynthesis protein [Xanthobacteraceae bacterium]